jgi:dihydropteroate synthase
VKDIIVDPGFGFGKTVEHNFTILKQLNVFNIFDCPVLVGLSRKSMICKTLKIDPKNALNGTTALHMVALMNGARILRVHDVKAAHETITLWKELQGAVKN